MKEKILVIDDEEDIRNLLAMALRGEGYEVVTAEGGADLPGRRGALQGQERGA